MQYFFSSSIHIKLSHSIFFCLTKNLYQKNFEFTEMLVINTFLIFKMLIPRYFKVLFGTWVSNLHCKDVVHLISH